MTLPIEAPGEAIKISPENLEVANTYLQTLDIVKTANDLGLEIDFVTDILANRDVRAYINAVFFDTGFNNRGRMRAAMDAVLRKKFQEMEESDTGSNKDIAELMALSHKMTMDQIAAEIKLEELKQKNSEVKSQTNIQINDAGGGNYKSLVERLIEANK